MDDKVVYCIRQSDDPKTMINTDSCETLWKTLAELHTHLTIHKDRITKHHRNHTWDRFKKVTNEYENVFAGNFQPISRSFFKLWEMLQDFKDNLVWDRPMKAVFLAEGPGGFAEAFVWLRHVTTNVTDDLHGMTLHSSDRRVPSWRLHGKLLQKVKICRGADGTGNLYVPANIEKLVRDTGGSNLCDLITADGGFDFSMDFNNQESLSLRLLSAETYAATCLQAPGGAFILKVYDVSTPCTLLLLEFLVKLYDHVNVVKPLTSRPANSEKYLVCCGYKSDTLLVQSIQKALVSCMVDGTPLSGAYGWYPSPWILSQAVAFNSFFVIRQCNYIAKTISCIDLTGGGELNPSKLTSSHHRYAAAWCTKYGINRLSLQFSSSSQKQTTDSKS